VRDFLKIDRKFGKTPLRYIIQCAVAGLVTMSFLSLLDLLTYRSVVAALGATTFMVFTMPHRVSSRARYVVGGYIMGAAGGVLCSLAFAQPGGIYHIQSVFLLGALAVGAAGLLMAATNTEHPPAAGLALGLVLSEWDFKTILYILGCVCFVSLIKHLLKRYLIDLL
jgi:CBS-domain-containing membrane protein